jgi:hypothetical protein
MLSIIKKLVSKLFTSSKYLGRIRFFFNKEKRYRTGEICSIVAFELEIERTDKKEPPAIAGPDNA